MEMKENETFSQGTYSNQTPYLFSQQILKCFNGFQNQNFSFMTTVEPNNGNETKSDIFSWGIHKSEIIFSLVTKYF